MIADIGALGASGRRLLSFAGRRRHGAATDELTYEKARLLSALHRPGCPICLDVAGDDRTYFFWLFNESYMESFNLDALTRSLGYCCAHGTVLTRISAYSYQLAAVHLVLIRRVQTILGERTGERRSALTDVGGCPPCSSIRESMDRCLFWLARLLEDPNATEHYGQPGLLCLPHLQRIVPLVTRPVLERLLAVHAEALGRALKSLADLRSEIAVVGVRSEDRARGLAPYLGLAVGHRALTALPGLDEVPSVRRARDPVTELLAALGHGRECPVCLEVRHAWLEWGQWLDSAGGRRHEMGDLLPTCPEHVRALATGGSTDLAMASIDHVLRPAADGIKLATDLLFAPSPPLPGRPVARLEERLAGPKRRERQARAGLTRLSPCPVCERLSVAETRTLELLFCLAADFQHRATINGGYGLCLKHFSRALALDPPSPIRQLLIEIEAAKLARLSWELEESQRKTSWRCRPEARGEEATSWSRAVHRFSGFLGARGLPPVVERST